MKKKTWHDKVFFGLHFDLHANEKDTELGKNLTVEHLIKELSKVKPDFVQCDCKGHPGYASYPTKVGVPSPGVVKDSLRIWRDATKQLGIPLVVHFSGIWDAVAVKNHPEWARINTQNNEKSNRPGEETDSVNRDKNMVCPISKYTTDYMIKQMIEIIDNYDVDGFWIDGENWACTPCYCDNCKELFLRKSGKKNVPMSKEEDGWDEWLEFQRHNFEEHVRLYTEEVHKRKPECTICSNWMYTFRQPDRINVPVDYLSGDFDWIWSTERAIVEGRVMDGRNISWDLMAWGFTSAGEMKGWTFKTVSALCQEAAVVMSLGGAFMIYDTPNRSGDLVEWHMDAIAEVARFCRARQEYCFGTKSLPQIVILHHKDHFYKYNSPLFNLGEANRQVEGALHAILDNNYHTDILCNCDLYKKLKSYKLCILPEQSCLSDDDINKLKEYVKEGGCLIVSGKETTKKFDDIAGIKDLEKIAGEEVGQPLYIKDGKATFTALGTWRLVKNKDAIEVEPLLFSRNLGEKQLNSGSPAAVIKQYGKGKIALIFGPVFYEYYRAHYPGARRFIRKIIECMEINGLAKVNAPVNVNVIIREKDDKLLINFVNLSSGKTLSPRNAMIEEVPPVGPISISMRLDKEPSKVFLAPSNTPVEWEFEKDFSQSESGLFKAKINFIGIHDILVIS